MEKAAAGLAWTLKVQVEAWREDGDWVAVCLGGAREPGAHRFSRRGHARPPPVPGRSRSAEREPRGPGLACPASTSRPTAVR